MQKRTVPFLIVVGLFGLGVSFLVNILDPFIYTEKVRSLAPATLKNSILSFITIMALSMAFIAQPLMGYWSDKTDSRWGRRIPYLTGGVVGIIFALVLVVIADNLWLLLIAAMLTSAFSNSVQSVWQALIPDYVPQSQHGTAAGIKTLLEIIGVIAGILLVGATLSRGNLWGAPLAAIVIFIVILLITIGVIGKSSSLRLSEMEIHSQKITTTPIQKSRRFMDRLSDWLADSPIRQVPAFPWWVMNRFLFWSSAIAIRTFMINYLEDVLSLSLAEAQALSSRLFLLLGVGVVLLALPAGAIADRVGRRPLLVVAGLMASCGAALLIFLRDPNMLFIAGGLIAGGAGIFASASWALVTDLVPDTEGALYLGLANGATIAGSIGGRLGGPLIDGLNQISGTSSLGYMVVFGIASLFFAGSSLIVLKIPEKP